jgi:hypothetical protein
VTRNFVPNGNDGCAAVSTFQPIGVHMPIANVHKSESDDFEAELRRHQRSANEFEVAATPQAPLSQEAGVIAPYRGSIKIRNKTTGAERSYPTGHATNWVADFSADLKAGVL